MQVFYIFLQLQTENRLRYEAGNLNANKTRILQLFPKIREIIIMLIIYGLNLMKFGVKVSYFLIVFVIFWENPYVTGFLGFLLGMSGFFFM